MARERKGGVIERITHPKTKRVGVLRMEKGSFTFFCRLPDEDLNSENKNTREYFESKDAHEVRNWINERISKSEKKHRLEWKPVIQVDFDRPERSHRQRDDESRDIRLSVEINRFYVALSHDRTEWLRLDWSDIDPTSGTTLDEDDRLARANHFRDGPRKPKPDSRWNHNDKPFALPLIEGDRSYLHYTEDAWAGLNEVIDTLERSASTLVEMIGTKKGLALIAEVGAGLKRLGSGNITAEEVVAEVVND